MKFLLPVFCLFVLKTNAQLESKLDRQFYRPLVTLSSTLKKIPRSVTQIDSTTPTTGFVCIIDYNSKGDIIRVGRTSNGKPYFQEEYEFPEGYYGANIKQVDFRKGKRELTREVISTKLTKNTFVTTSSYYGPLISTSYDTSLTYLQLFYYSINKEREIVEEQELLSHPYDGAVSETIRTFDFQGNLLTVSHPRDSMVTTYYYPKPSIYKSKNPPLSLPDSSITQQQHNGVMTYDATIHVRNEWHDLKSSTRYYWRYGEERHVGTEWSFNYKYDQYGNWTRCEIQEISYFGDHAEFKTPTLTLRSFRY